VSAGGFLGRLLSAYSIWEKERKRKSAGLRKGGINMILGGSGDDTTKGERKNRDEKKFVEGVTHGNLKG